MSDNLTRNAKAVQATLPVSALPFGNARTAYFEVFIDNIGVAG